MKKRIILLITMLGLIVFTGCNSTTNQSNDSSSTSESASETTNNFDELNIVSCEVEKEDRESYDEEIITTFKIFKFRFCIL